MTDIGHIGSSQSSHSISSIVAPGRLEESSAPNRESNEARSRDVHTNDRVEISPHAREHAMHLPRIKALPEVRTELIASARAAIENGSLDTPQNLEIAVGNLLDELDQL
jgi:anti-sigma28 factor (negative regulator of flagellin synthesis)